jgi:hypothetical protein
MQETKWLSRRLDRLDWLAELFERNGFTTIANEVRSLRTETEVKNFYDALKGWLF